MFYRWAWQGVVQHVGLWLLIYGLLVLILQRPWYAMANALAFVVMLVQVSNAKYDCLREPFVYQDFEYFADALRHPRLYIPFLGWWKTSIIVAVAVCALAVGMSVEAGPADFADLAGRALQAALCAALGGALLMIPSGGPPLCFRPEEDMMRFGFLGYLWRYRLSERTPLSLPALLPNTSGFAAQGADLLVVQSESFSDIRSMVPGVRSEILSAFDSICDEALQYGELKVPAWGANTVRSEFAFLTGASEATLGVHRFNPYRRFNWGKVTSLAEQLKAAGYRTVCIHPYPSSFYKRDIVYPRLGFEEFLDLRSFTGAERNGPFISDLAVAEKVKEVLGEGTKPIFLFAITMENHGPLHLEKPSAQDLADAFAESQIVVPEELTVYLRHIRNADRMIRDLREFLRHRVKSTYFCWYGDHVPIMEGVYQKLGYPSGNTNYFVWHNRINGYRSSRPLAVSELAACLVQLASSLNES